MPPELATLLCLTFIIYLFWEDYKQSDESSSALWIPVVWMFLAGSRGVSQWLNPRDRFTSPEAYLDGSPLDAVVILFLILAAVILLAKRRINWVELLKNNHWIWLYFLFGLLSIFWSDYPFISFKRWVKASGTLIMALIIMTDQQPCKAIEIVLRRLMFSMLPLSVLFIKYYPELGREYIWGKTMYTGVATQKNGLGQLCLMSGIYFMYFYWHKLQGHWNGRNRAGNQDLLINVALVAMSIWLLYMSESATSLVCIGIAAGLFMISRMQSITEKPDRIVVVIALTIFFLGAVEIVFDVSDSLLSILGRDPTLTTRVPMWNGLLALAQNPLWGSGYESFWLGDRLRLLWKTYGSLIHAHNGYLETYLNLGVIGLILLAGCILSGIRKIREYLNVDYSFAIVQLCFVIIVSTYNITEATFHGVNNMWLLFFWGIMDMQGSSES